MTELDFDELDKAVNSLMAENGPEDSPSFAPVAPAPSSAPASVPAPAVAQDDAAQSPSPAVRRRGQFMDVIHPSASMRSMQTPASRQGLGVTPPTMQASVAPDTTPESDATFTVPTSSDSTPDTVEVQNVAPTETPAPQWPDPIDMMTPHDAFAEPATQGVEMQEPQAAPAEPAVELDESEDPLSSPFLADAKVEKRPLGNGLPSVDENPESVAVEPALADAVGEPAQEEVATGEPEHHEEPVAEPISLPDELQQDVVAVESNEVSHEDIQVEAPVAEMPAPVAAAETTAENAPIAPSITQQYQEQPSTGDQTNGAIFDTSTYHQPLEAHPAKKKSAVLTWILWVIVLLIIGATAGAAWFYFTTQ